MPRINIAGSQITRFMGIPPLKIVFGTRNLKIQCYTNAVHKSIVDVSGGIGIYQIAVDNYIVVVV